MNTPDSKKIVSFLKDMLPEFMDHKRYDTLKAWHRDAVIEIESLSKRVDSYRNIIDSQIGVIQELQLRVSELEAVCRNAYEVYAGSEGIPEPETAAEAYVYQLLMQMKDEIARGLK
jgi:hypothetical protein